MEEIRNQIDALLAQKERVLIAIDGKCTSGKTTLAGKLAQVYDCNIFHMDDFFLRPEQRTDERFAEPGGNVDYERFYREVLVPLKAGQAFSYRPFDCRSFTLGAPVFVSPRGLNIIEGTYSHHPYFGEPYDLKLLLTVDEETQRQRILRRPAHLHQRFFSEWIPMEKRYFQWLRTVEFPEISEGDYDVFHRLANEYYREGEDEHTPQDEIDGFIGFLFDKVLRREFQGCFARAGGRCIGFGLWAVDTEDFAFSELPGLGTILELGITPSRRGCGHGRELAAHIESSLGQMGIRQCYVSAYGPARSFWTACGYEPTGLTAANGLPIMIKTIA